jgi:hypothetical protein
MCRIHGRCSSVYKRLGFKSCLQNSVQKQIIEAMSMASSSGSGIEVSFAVIGVY